VVVVIEDIDGMCRDKEVETELINLLDGVEHSSNVVYLATTNHIELLEERITNRPSRFDRRYHIKEPDEDVRKVFIEAKMKKQDLEKIDIDHWVKETEGFNLAHIKELIITVVIYGNTLEYGLNHLNEMRKRPEVDNSFTQSGNQKFGFHN
jgi:ATP-dependent 26S proteasome regulatory subunit